MSAVYGINGALNRAAGRLCGSFIAVDSGETNTPVTTAGEYFIEISTQYTTGGIGIKQPRSAASGFGVRRAVENSHEMTG